jgi:hypothetical protein
MPLHELLFSFAMVWVLVLALSGALALLLTWPMPDEDWD